MGRTSNAKERLLDSALELISARSYKDVGVQELCQHSGVKKGSFYHFFESKRDLVLAAVERQAECKRDYLDELFGRDISPLEKLRTFFQEVYQKNEECKAQQGSMQGCCFGNLAVEMATVDPAIRDTVQGFLEQPVPYVESAIKEAAEQGQIAPGDAHIRALSFLALLQGAMVLAKSRNEPELIRQIGSTLFESLGAGTLA